MAIIIPSKNIYDKQNPKIVDNVIDRIEIGATAISPNNQYGVSVFETKNKISSTNLEDYGVKDFVSKGIGATNVTYEGSYSSCKLHYYQFSFFVPYLGENKYISKIYSWKNETNETNEPNGVEYSLTGIKYVQPLSATFTFLDNSGYSSNYQYGNMSVEQDGRINMPKIKNGKIDEVSLNIEVQDNTEISIRQDVNGYTISGSILVAVEFENAKGSATVGITSKPSPIQISGQKVVYEASEVEFTVLGNTIGINLTNKTISIPTENAGSKKVFSLVGNELMQESNYYVESIERERLDLGDYSYELYDDSRRASISILNEYYRGKNLVAVIVDEEGVQSEHQFVGRLSAIHINNGYHIKYINVFANKETTVNAIEKSFKKTQKSYANGREIATILCSISDYIDIETNEKIISIDNSTGKMSFNEYDEVIPMVYGSDGKDHPMSYYQDGTPKVFKVLGVNKFYDGAVWQKLSLQEI